MSEYTGGEPAFDDLPVMADLGIQHSWDILAPNLGTLEATGVEADREAVSPLGVDLGEIAAARKRPREQALRHIRRDQRFG